MQARNKYNITSEWLCKKFLLRQRLARPVDLVRVLDGHQPLFVPLEGVERDEGAWGNKFRHAHFAAFEFLSSQICSILQQIEQTAADMPSQRCGTVTGFSLGRKPKSNQTSSTTSTRAVTA